MATFGLLHGGAHTAFTWHYLEPELRGRGHRVVAPDLPYDVPGLDTAALTEAARSELAGHPDLVVVAHSFGGSILPAVARAAAARAMIFLAAVVPEPGRSIQEQAADRPIILFPYDRAVFDEDGLLRVPENVAREYFYPDVPPDIMEQAIANLRRQSTGVLAEPMPADGWPDLPAGYIVASDDRLVDVEWSRWVSRTRLGREAWEIPGSHSPMFARPAELADLLVKVSSELFT